jgi:tRNA(Ser,Leu) C12 N-acetylase TAN1
MTAYVERQEGETGPLRRELEAARELLEKRRREYDKMLDLYLEGRMSKDMIGARVEALNREIDSLQASERELLIQLEAATLTERRIADLEQFAAEIRKRLDYADHDFSKRRWAVETLDVTGLWRVVDGKQVLDVQCIISGEILGLSDIAI